MSDRTVVSALVKQLLAKDWRISIHDGEDWCLKRSIDPKEIMANLFATDEEILLIRDQNGTKLGRILLVYGNEPDGSEVVADYSTGNAEFAGLMDAFIGIEV